VNLAITGASGFIGSALCARLIQDGHALTLLTHGAPRDASASNKRWLHWTPGAAGEWEKAIDGCDGIINLAGEPIATRRWTNRQKRKIRLSRVDATASLVGAIAKATKKPKFLISGSAVGIYGDCGNEPLTEQREPGDDFLASVCRDWEAQAAEAESLGCRVALLRTGIVLDAEGGALDAIARPFQFLVGGPLGSGKQWMSWIHLDDEIGIIKFIIENEQARGAINATAPNPVSNGDFSKALGRAMKRPSWFGVPAFGLRLMLGEMAEMLLTGQRAIPAAAQRLGYQFRFPELKAALEACIR
jgi:hypothetical protein